MCIKSHTAMALSFHLVQWLYRVTWNKGQRQWLVWESKQKTVGSAEVPDNERRKSEIKKMQMPEGIEGKTCEWANLLPEVSAKHMAGHRGQMTMGAGYLQIERRCVKLIRGKLWWQKTRVSGREFQLWMLSLREREAVSARIWGHFFISLSFCFCFSKQCFLLSWN